MIYPHLCLIGDLLGCVRCSNVHTSLQYRCVCTGITPTNTTSPGRLSRVNQFLCWLIHSTQAGRDVTEIAARYGTPAIIPLSRRPSITSVECGRWTHCVADITAVWPVSSPIGDPASAIGMAVPSLIGHGTAHPGTCVRLPAAPSPLCGSVGGRAPPAAGRLAQLRRRRPRRRRGSNQYLLRGRSHARSLIEACPSGGRRRGVV